MADLKRDILRTSESDDVLARGVLSWGHDTWVTLSLIGEGKVEKQAAEADQDQ
jgi:hypothetical protein